tara:strand:+ start:4107 stop:4460 length:354 start_codon:yes stop_codon:yes gene_type:complete
MADLIACLSTGKGTWGHVSRLIQEGTWENILIITNEFGKENFSNEKNAELLIVNSSQPTKELVSEIESKLKGKLNREVALNLISGTGKEHMSILAALLKLGVGIKLTALTKDGIEEI